MPFFPHTVSTPCRCPYVVQIVKTLYYVFSITAGTVESYYLPGDIGMGKIIVLAIVLRLFLLTSVPPSLNWDEVSRLYRLLILQTGKDEWGRNSTFFRSYGEWKSAVYIYLLLPFIKYWVSTLCRCLPSVLAGIISVYLMYLSWEENI